MNSPAYELALVVLTFALNYLPAIVTGLVLLVLGAQYVGALLPRRVKDDAGSRMMRTYLDLRLAARYPVYRRNLTINRRFDEENL